jgi:hypothetical protein
MAGGYRYPYPTIWLLYVVLAVVTPVTHIVVLYIGVGVIWVGCLWVCLDTKGFLKVSAAYPGLNRSNWCLNWIIWPIAVPFLVILTLKLLLIQ